MMIMTKFVPQGLPEVVIQLEGYSMAYHSLPRGRFILLRVICRGKSAHFRLQLTTGETKVMIRKVIVVMVMVMVMVMPTVMTMGNDDD